MEAYIIDGIRTPIGKLGGSLATVRADDLASFVLAELVRRNPSIPVKFIDDVILGCANQAGDDNRNVARMALLLAGLPFTIPGETVNRLCSSGMSAIINASRAIKSGDGHVYIAGGVENMTRGPWVISKSNKPFGNDSQMADSSFGWRFINPKMQKTYGTDSMGITAENLVEKYQIKREDQDMFAYQSQMRASQAQKNGRLSEEILPIEITINKNEKYVFENDEFIKESTTREKLAQLAPAFKKEGGTITAGNSSGLNDGAACVYVASNEAVRKYNLHPIARIVSSSVVGVEPRVMGIGPVEASRNALGKADLKLGEIDVIELNEAFAAQSIACLRELGLHDDDPRVNPNGGAIALGHPLGMSGTRIVYSAAKELQKQSKRFALATMCVGVGQGFAVVLEKV